MASKNAPDLIVSGAGWLIQFVSKVSNGLIASGYTKNDIHRLGHQQGEEEMNRGVTAFVNAIKRPPVPSYDPVINLYRWLVNYDETIAEKLKKLDPKTIGWATDYATDEKFPDSRKGMSIVAGKPIHFGNIMHHDRLEREVNGRLSRPKEFIDFLKAFPRPALDEHMPLTSAGQFWTNSLGNRYFLYSRLYDEGRRLDDLWMSPGDEWDARWRFLVLCLCE